MKILSALFSLLILLFIHVTEARKHPKTRSSSIGDITNISYPFRLKEDPGGCGDPDLELSCHNNTTTILNFHGGLYKVKSISYDKHVIRVVDVNLANVSCGLPYKALSIEDVLFDPRYPRLADYNHSYKIYFVRYYNNIGNLQNSIEVPCLSGNSSHVYVSITWPETLSSHDISKSCKIVSAVPATYENMLQQQDPSYETILKMQKSGFDVGWSVECRDCVAKGRGCSYESADTTNIFKCEKEADSEDELAREIYAVLAALFLLAIIVFDRFILLPLVILASILHKYFSTRKKIDVTENSSRIQQPSNPER